MQFSKVNRLLTVQVNYYFCECARCCRSHLFGRFFRFYLLLLFHFCHSTLISNEFHIFIPVIAAFYLCSQNSHFQRCEKYAVNSIGLCSKRHLPYIQLHIMCAAGFSLNRKKRDVVTKSKKQRTTQV